MLLSILLSCGENQNPSADDTRVLTYEDTLPLVPPKTKVKISAVEEIQQAYAAIMTQYKEGSTFWFSLPGTCNT